MIENTKNAIKHYKDLLKKNKLEEKKEYLVNFTLKCLLDTFEIKKIIPRIMVDNFELSPALLFDCYTNEYVGNFGIMNEKFILDKYDKEGIIKEFNGTISSVDYDSKLFSKILDKMKVKI